MAKEIERKFLVVDNSYRESAESVIEIIQGYLSADPDRTVRIRLYGDKAFLTVKTRNDGALRHEWEYEIPAEDAREMLEKAAVNVLSKRRYLVPASEKGLVWEVDEFGGALSGLVIAEVELPELDTPVNLPVFVGDEITGDPRYYNSNLAAQA